MPIMALNPHEFVAYKVVKNPGPPGGPSLPDSLEPVDQFSMQHVLHHQIRVYHDDGNGQYEKGLIIAILYPKFLSLNHISGNIPLNQILYMCITATPQEGNVIWHGGAINLVKATNTTVHPVTYLTQRATDFHPAAIEPMITISSDGSTSGHMGYLRPIPKEISEATVGKDDHRKMKPLNYFCPSAVNVTPNPHSGWTHFMENRSLNFPLGTFCGTAIPLDTNLTRPPKSYSLFMGQMKLILPPLFSS